jgi:triphosphatase
VEGVHQIRVAIRRLRSALKLLERSLEPHAAALFGKRASAIGRITGEARDRDMFSVEILRQSLEKPGDAE